MQPTNDNYEQSELATLFTHFCQAQVRMGNELINMASIVRAMSEKITEIEGWNT